MTKVKVSFLKDLVKLRASREIELVLVLPAEVIVPLVRGKVVDLLEVLDSKGMEILEEEVLLYAAGVITGTLESVGRVAMDVLHVDMWDIEL
ncbi:hypothetical protein ACFX19_040543 [Malus domestica]